MWWPGEVGFGTPLSPEQTRNTHSASGFLPTAGVMLPSSQVHRKAQENLMTPASRCFVDPPLLPVPSPPPSLLQPRHHALHSITHRQPDPFFNVAPLEFGTAFPRNARLACSRFFSSRRQRQAESLRLSTASIAIIPTKPHTLPSWSTYGRKSCRTSSSTSIPASTTR